ncbi:HAMP domain-containing sensor histidine kinase [Granulicella tundricola]|nr:ATP-binding protein [Granulicella tundricola]
MGVLTLVLLVYLAVVYIFQYGLLTSQIYHDEVQDVETVEGLLRFDSQGELVLDQSYHSHPQSHLLADRLMEVRDFTGTVLYRTDTLHGMTLGKVTQTEDEGDSSFNERTVRLADGTRVLVISHRHPVQGRMLLIRLGYSLSPLMSRMRNFLFALILALPLALVCAGFAGYTIVRKSLAPLDAMASRAEQITAYELSGRLEVENRQDELGRVAVVFNSLLERLERSFTQLQRFTADAAHELRTPLSSIRVVGESALRGDQSAALYRETIGSMLEETLRLNQTVEGLLLISRAEAGEIRLELTSFSVHDLIGDLLSILDVLLEENELIVKEHTLEPSRMMVLADRTFLRTCLLNVLHNAAKFSPLGGTITISYAHVEKHSRPFLRVSILDEGVGLSPDHREKVFERFFRVRDSSLPVGDGAGLGLAIARLAIEANSGAIYFDPTEAQGALCQIEIPV